MNQSTLYKICFFVPVGSEEEVKEAMFSTGAGRIGDYEACAWQTEGMGQFRPLAGSQPTIGKIDQLERLKELKVEMVCAGEYIKAAIQALKESHPYETPAYEVIALENN